MTFQTLSCVACLSAIAATAAPQVLTRDDAGDTLATAGELHVGVNQCRFDYRLPRGMDVDVWTLTTVPGRLYRVDATALDDLAESFASLAVNESHSRTDALASLGFAGASWARGNGNPLVRTFRGLARADGWPVRYMIEVDVADDPGDPEGGDLAHAAPLSIGEWYSGAFSPPAPPSQPVTVVYSQEGYDVDAFTFPFEDRGVYRFEVEVEGSYAGLANPQWRGVATRTSPYVFFSTPASLASNDTVVECRGSGTAWFTLSGGFDDGPSRAYRVRISRIGTAPADDHGDTPERATVLNVGAAPARANLTSRVSAPTVSRTIVDLDWFSVQTVAGHAYEARVERSPIGGAAVEDVLSEDGLHHADALPNGHQVAPNTNLLASVRFHGRGDRPVKFGLLGTGNVSVAVTDLGTVADSVGDPLTGPGVLSTAQPTVSGQLEHPRDVDSFSIEPPGVPGVYRVNYTVQWAPGASPGIGPGVALTTPEGRTGVFHNT
ncbi:MAG: hypothetical protein K2Q09_11330 [Phycisphaerales bacterium]|nr:hypothetical protein [Phycisphaerales bacterium]